jgi:hypothetical protein
MGADMVAIISGEAKVDSQVAAFRPTELCERLLKGSSVCPRCRIVFGPADEPADPPYALRLLRPHRDWPRRSGAEKGEELPPLHFAPKRVKPSTAETLQHRGTECCVVRHSKFRRSTSGLGPKAEILRMSITLPLHPR